MKLNSNKYIFLDVVPYFDKPIRGVKIQTTSENSPGGVLPEKLGGVCSLLPKTLTLFMSKICDIPNPIYDQNKNSKPYLWAEPYIKILFHTCIIISLDLCQITVNIICEWLFDNDEKVASS